VADPESPAPTRSDTSQKPTDSDLLIHYRLRTIHISVRVTFLAFALLAALPFLPGHPAIDVALYISLLALGVAVTAVTWWGVPWPRAFEAGWGEWAMYAWSILNILLVTLFAAAAGGPRSEVVFFYPLTTVFIAASYPARRQVGLFGFTCAAYLTMAGIWDPPPPVSVTVVRIGSLATVWFMATFLSRERADEMKGHLRLRRLAEHRADLLAAVARATAAITTLDTDQVMSGVTESLVELGFNLANFCVLEDGGRQYRVRYARGLPHAYTESVHPSGVGMVALVIQRRGPVVVREYASHPLAVPGLRNVGVQAVIAAPVWVDGEVAAVLVGGKTLSPDLSTSDVEVFEILADQVGRAMESARRFQAEHRTAEKASAASLRDELTGVGNRRRSDALLKSLRPGDAVLLIDLDHFKDINDQQGHTAGDQVLANIGTYLRTSVRDGDDVARYGGEEFVIIMRGAGGAALETARRIYSGWRLLHPLILFSGGVAVFGGSGDDAADEQDETTFARADSALYAAKEAGRDRICEHYAKVASG
jgi:diguanylate cyclase (GGDEF)-like protein